MLSIDIYHKYKVELECETSGYSGEYSRDFWGNLDVEISTSYSKDCFEKEGGEIMEIISKFLADTDIDQIEFGDDTIYFSWFNPMTGLSSESTWKLVKIDEATVV